MKVRRNTLLLLACLVWSAAGFNILRIGLMAYPSYRSMLNFLFSALVFVAFQKFVFGPLVKKHTARIHSYREERHFFLKFFDGKAFAIMAVMMTGGIGLRVSGLASERFIAVFYSLQDYCLAVISAKRHLPPPQLKTKQNIKENDLCRQSQKPYSMPSI